MIFALIAAWAVVGIWGLICWWTIDCDVPLAWLPFLVIFGSLLGPFILVLLLFEAMNREDGPIIIRKRK